MKNLLQRTSTILLCIVLCVLSWTQCEGQMPTVGGNVAFSSPQAASISKFGGHSLNYSTGTPNIDIPIVTVSEGALSLPISLHYTYSGFRPSDQASWVGLGFSLMSGGVVSRTIRGLPDELAGHGYLNEPQKITNFVSQSSFGIASFKNNGIENLDDPSPDSYNFQFNGYSGKVVIDNQGNGRVVSSAPIVVKYERATDSFAGLNYVISKWIFTTEDGTIYTFSNREYTETNMEFSPVGPNAEYMPSAWYLSEIADKTGNKITFEYTTAEKTTTGSRLQYGRSEQYEFVTLNAGSNDITNSRVQVSENKTSEIYLTKISGSNWQLVFNSESYNRLSDQFGILLYARKLNSIELKTNTASPTTIKQFTFEYTTQSSYRLHLLKVKEEGSNPYTMTYDSYASSNILGRDANVDYWGYYNAVNNATLVPQLGADLEPREYAAKMGALVRLTYATKGYTTIDYEQNQYSYFRDLVRTDTATTILTRVYRRFWNHEFSHPDSSGMYSLVLTKPTLVHVRLNNNTTNTSLPACANQGTFWPRTLQAGTYTMNDIMAIYNFLPCDRPDIGSSPGFDITLEFKIFEKTASNRHKFGGLRVKSMTDFTGNANESYTSTFSYHDTSDTTLSSGVVGFIPYYELVLVNTVGIIRVYRATPFNPEALSQLYYRSVSVTRDGSVTNYKYTSHSNQNDYHGKWAFVYDKGVSTLSGVLAEDYTVTNFYGMGSYGDYSFLRSLPSEIEVKDSNGNLKQKTSYQYSGWGENTLNIPSLHYELFAQYDNYPDPLSLDPSPRLVFYGKAYYQVGGWPRKTSETVTTYGSNNTDPVAVTTTYEYGSNHLQLKKQQVTQSNGAVKETTYTYPLDYSAATGNAVLQAMIASNMVAYPIEQVTKLGAKVVDASLTTYNSFVVESGKPAIVLPYKKFRFSGFNNSIPSFTAYTGSNNEATTSYYETTKYVAYGKKGNLLSVLLNNSHKVSYLWAYKSQHPVAEIQNADNAQVLSGLGGTSFDAMADETSSATILSKINSLRSNLGSSLVTGYLYEPLVGLTQKIAPNALSTYYTYDVLERLEKVKDTNSQTVKSYKYNYATP
ncbi:hypothetical protein LZD49_13455 [Dyadobacter sp. CY261]|uniref:hypothetical protein n=1 Tax=Dyadobacter sp. CY261 TaxID=2907203 RepID=UPI001F1F09FF|nr:hypothetical protein [Dyadobacter sp. CY261]MCF0071482.1 hypothetical protein [Dyadobacter sp. CY261]